MVSVLNSKDANAVLEQESFSLIRNEKLLEIYAAMVKCQMIEQRITELFSQERIAGGSHHFVGRACSAAAVAIDLQPDDKLCISVGDWLPAFVKGMSLESLFLSSAATAADRGSILAAEATQKDVLLAADDAQQRNDVLHCVADTGSREKNAIVAVFLTPAPGALKKWQDVMTMAAKEKLPIVFVRHTDADAAPKAKSVRARDSEALLCGVPAIAVDAADAVAIYRVAFEAFVRARQGRGATLLECFGNSVTGAVDSEASRQALAPAPVDPILAMESYLRRKGIDPGHHQCDFLEAFRRDLALATQFLDR